MQAEDGPQQHRLARSRAADDPEHLALEHRHVEAIVDDLPPETVDDTPDVDRRGHHQIPISMNSTANSASARITRKIAITTATVVSRPSSREEPRTCMPQ